MSQINPRELISSAWMLTGFVVLAITLVASINELTKQSIANQEHKALLGALSQVLPANHYNNALTKDILLAEQAPPSKGFVLNKIYRARKRSSTQVVQPVALVLDTQTLNSYSGTPIKLLIGIDYNGTLTGVRVITHKETPGLGDKIVLERDPWIETFTGKSLSNPSPEQWKVKKDDGVFDQFTGATITPRAIVNSVRSTLQYVQTHNTALYATDTQNEPTQ